MSNGVQAPLTLESLQETVQRQEWTIELLQESLAGVGMLELALEDQGWSRIAAQGKEEFSRDGLGVIAEASRVYAIKSPIVNRGVSLEAFYVWAQGVSIQAKHDEINAVVQAFLDDEKNRAELGHQARMEKEVELQTDGNLFFAFFVNKSSGRVRVRSVPFSEMQEILCNPEDRKEPWYYKRVWQQDVLDSATGQVQPKTKTAYHPDWRYRPARGSRLTSIGGAAVEWDAPVYHIKVGGFSDWKFGISEVYAALDWAKIAKTFLENVATIMKTLSTFAAKLTNKGGSRAVAASKAKLDSGVSSQSGGVSRNPPPATGSVFIAGENTDYTPYQLRGASISPEDGRRFLLMAYSAMGWPETFFGDASTGSLATARSLDRPTELRIKNRQTLWSDILKAILGYVLFWAVKAPSGPLRAYGIISADEDGHERVEWMDDVETGKPLNASVAVDFPPIVEHDVSESVDAIVTATTLGGKAPAGTIDLKTSTRMLLIALGQENVDEMLDALFPDGDVANEAPTLVPKAVATGTDPQVMEVARQLREALAAFTGAPS